MLDAFEEREKLFPERADRDKGEKADAGDEVGEPVRGVEAREVRARVEKDGRKGEDECGPYDDAEGAGPFGKEEKPGEKEGQGDEVDDDRKNDGGGGTDEVIDEIVFGVDERTGKVEQIQVRKAKGDRGWMGEDSQSLISFRMR
jgi:hypothetical protein